MGNIFEPLEQTGKIKDNFLVYCTSCLTMEGMGSLAEILKSQVRNQNGSLVKKFSRKLKTFWKKKTYVFTIMDLVRAIRFCVMQVFLCPLSRGLMQEKELVNTGLL